MARLVASLLLSHDLGIFLRQFLFAAAVIGHFEWHCSTQRTVSTFLAVDTLGTLIVLFNFVPLVASLPAQDHPTAHQTLDIGISAGGFGLIGAIPTGWPCKGLLMGAALKAIGITVLHSFQITADSAHAKCSGRPCWGLLLARIATIYYRRTNANSIRHKMTLTSQIEIETR